MMAKIPDNPANSTNRGRPIAVALALLVAVWSVPCAAEVDPAEIYTVRNVVVDTTAATAADARDIALDDGQRRAYAVLIRRLVPGDRVADVPPLPKEDLAGLVQNFEVADEKTSAVRYIAQLTFRFNRNGVRRFLRQTGIPFAEAASDPVLVLPVYRQAGAYLLWDNPNSWRSAWQALPPSDGLVPIVVPKGDIKDIADIGAEQAVAGNAERLNAIAGRYQVGSVILALARLAFDNATLTPFLEVTLSHFQTERDDRVTVRSFTAAPGETSETMIQRAASEMARQIQENWKTENVLRFDRQNDLFATVALADLADWVALRKILSDISFINRFQLVSMTRNAATIRLEYYGDEERLNTALQRNELELSRGPASWILHPRGAAERSAPIAPGTNGTSGGAADR